MRKPRRIFSLRILSLVDVEGFRPLTPTRRVAQEPAGPESSGPENLGTQPEVMESMETCSLTT
jgi:hypothetical protein